MEADWDWVGVPAGDRDPDSPGTDVLLSHEDSSALWRAEERRDQMDESSSMEKSRQRKQLKRHTRSKEATSGLPEKEQGQ